MEQDFYTEQQQKITQQISQTEQPAYMPPAKKPRMFLMMLSVLFLLGIGIVGGYFLGTSKSSIKQTPSKTPSLTKKLSPTPQNTLGKTYTDDMYTMHYPSNWTVSEDPKNTGVHTFSDPSSLKTRPNNGSGTISYPTRYVTVSVQTSIETPKHYADFITSGPQYSGISSQRKTITFNGQPAETYKEYGEGSDGYDIVVSNGSTLAVITIPSSYPPSDKEISQMLSSFTFRTRSSDTASMKLFSNANPSFTINYPADYYVTAQENGVDFTPEKPVLTAPSVLNGFGITYNDPNAAAKFTALRDAKVGDDVESVHGAIDVKVTKLKNLTVDGVDAVEFIYDGTIPPSSGLGRGPIPYSHIFLIKINEKSFVSIANSSMQSADVKARDTLFSQMISSLTITK